MFFDFHTHNPSISPGTGIVCLSREVLLHPYIWQPASGGLYAAGIHPWWTAREDFSLSPYLAAIRELLSHPEVVQIGECGLDRLKGAAMDRQWEVFAAQIQMSEEYHRPMTLHVVKAFDLVLAARKRFQPQQKWTIHGFRGKAETARQLLAAGFDLSFGRSYNAEALAAVPTDRRHFETDEMAG